jgi:hypothetical protein
VPMIAAVNGPALIHAELALLCDIVLVSQTAVSRVCRIFRADWGPGRACTWYSRCCSEPIAGAISSLMSEKIDAKEVKPIFRRETRLNPSSLASFN